jgi:hypothetical protein
MSTARDVFTKRNDADVTRWPSRSSNNVYVHVLTGAPWRCSRGSNNIETSEKIEEEEKEKKERKNISSSHHVKRITGDPWSAPELRLHQSTLQYCRWCCQVHFPGHQKDELHQCATAGARGAAPDYYGPRYDVISFHDFFFLDAALHFIISKISYHQLLNLAGLLNFVFISCITSFVARIDDNELICT